MNEVAFISIRRLLCLFLLIYLCHPFVDSRALNGSNEDKKEQLHKNESVSVEIVKENNIESKETQGNNGSNNEIQERDFITLTTKGFRDKNEVTQSLPSVNNEANLESNVVTNTPDDNVVIITEGSKTYEIRNGVITEIPTPHHLEPNNEENMATESPKNHDEATRDSSITNIKTETRNLTTSNDNQKKLHANNESTELFTGHLKATVEKSETALGSGDDNDATQISHSFITNTTNESNSRELTDTNTSLEKDVIITALGSGDDNDATQISHSLITNTTDGSNSNELTDTNTSPEEDVIITEGNKTFMVKNGAITEIPPPRASELKVATNSAEITEKEIGNSNVTLSSSQITLGSGDNIGDTKISQSVSTDEGNTINSQEKTVENTPSHDDDVVIITEGSKTFMIKNGVITEIPTPRASEPSKINNDETIVTKDPKTEHTTNAISNKTNTNSEVPKITTNNEIEENGNVDNETSEFSKNETNNANASLENVDHSTKSDFGSGDANDANESSLEQTGLSKASRPDDDVKIISEGGRTFELRNGVITEITTHRTSDSSEKSTDENISDESRDATSRDPNTSSNSESSEKISNNQESDSVSNESTPEILKEIESNDSNTPEGNKSQSIETTLGSGETQVLHSTRTDNNGESNLQPGPSNEGRVSHKAQTPSEALTSRKTVIIYNSDAPKGTHSTERSQHGRGHHGRVSHKAQTPSEALTSRKTVIIYNSGAPKGTHSTERSQHGRGHHEKIVSHITGKTFVSTRVSSGSNLNTRAVYNSDLFGSTHSTGGSERRHGISENKASRGSASTHNPSSVRVYTNSIQGSSLMGSTHSTGGITQKQSSSKSRAITSGSGVQAIQKVFESTHSTGGFKGGVVYSSSGAEKESTILNRSSKSTSSYNPFTLVKTMRKTIGRGTSIENESTKKSSKYNNVPLRSSNRASISGDGQSPVTSNSNVIRTFSSARTAESSRPDPSVTSKMGSSFTNTVNAIFSSSMKDLIGGVTRKVVSVNSPQHTRLPSDVSSQTISAAPAEEVNTASAGEAASANNNAGVVTPAVRNTGTTSSFLTRLFNLVTNSNVESVTGQK